jgi:hypothetical protein
MNGRTAVVALASVAAAVSLLAGCGGSNDSGSEQQTASPAELAGVKDYLTDHTQSLTSFTTEFRGQSERYYTLARASGFDPKALWRTHADELRPLLRSLQTTWIEGNPLYERMEGIVAGTPSLSQYDVILDAGSSAAEDPQSAVPFDLKLPNGRVVEQPGNLYNVTEGALWGTLPAGLPRSSPVDVDGDGKVEFGEVLPDPNLLVSATRAFDRYARELDSSAAEWSPTDSDAFTSLVVMVPTMSEYFGQWKESRFVLGDRSSAESFNVVSRLSDIGDILTGLEIVYDGVKPRVAHADPAQARQTERELGDLSAFVNRLRVQERSGRRFEPEQAEVLGSEAQERGTAIAGQISQAASSLGITIEQ